MDKISTIKVLITKEFQNLVDFLHKEVGNKEWSGVLYYTMNTPELTDETVLKPIDIFLMDIHHQTYTEFTLSQEDANLSMIKLMDLGDNVLRGDIHTHHTMQSFFSSTDESTFYKNVTESNDGFVFSLIVNFSKNYCGRVGFNSTQEIKYNNKVFKIKPTITYLECVFEFENPVQVPQEFKDRYELVKNKSFSKFHSYNGYQNKNHWENYKHSKKNEFENESKPQDFFRYLENVSDKEDKKKLISSESLKKEKEKIKNVLTYSDSIHKAIDEYYEIEEFTNVIYDFFKEALKIKNREKFDESYIVRYNPNLKEDVAEYEFDMKREFEATIGESLLEEINTSNFKEITYSRIIKELSKYDNSYFLVEFIRSNKF